MSTRKEQYLLGRSSQFTLTTAGENQTDLTLNLNSKVNYGVIAAEVITGATPLSNALVQIFDSLWSPVEAQFTNPAGLAISGLLPAGLYRVVASAPGYLTSAPATASLPGAAGIKVSLSLTVDPRAALNTIYGLVLDELSRTRLNNATVTLNDLSSQIIASTLTNNDGQYLLSEVADGSYTITASRGGYEAPLPLPVTIAGGNIARTEILLAPEAVTEGTVQGSIKDQSGVFLPGACVGLYAVTGSTETLVQTTFTNDNGFYLFGNVPAGTYLVKAKVDTLV